MASLSVEDLQLTIPSGDFSAVRSTFPQLQPAGDSDQGLASVQGTYNAGTDTLTVAFVFEVAQGGLNISSTLLTVSTAKGDSVGLSLQAYFQDGNRQIWGGNSFVGLGKTFGGDTLSLEARANLKAGDKQAGELVAQASVTLS